MSATASFAQTGFTTKTYPAANDTILRVADFNGDGKPDLLGYSPSFNGGNIYMNNGSGGFAAPVALPDDELGYIQLAKIADMNGDGSPDIVACFINYGRTANYASLIIYLNDGKGNFTAGQITSLPYESCSGIAIADVNRDGDQDVIVAVPSVTETADNVIVTYFGDGNGDLRSPVTQTNINLDSPSTGSAYTNCSIVDLNSGNFYLDGQVSIFVNTNCMSTSTTASGSAGTTFLGHGNGTGNFTYAFSHASNEYLTDGHTVDVNQDGKPDSTFYSVAAQHTPNLYYAENMGSGSFTYNNLVSEIEAGGDPTPMQFGGDATADLTGDNLNDIASFFMTTAYTSLGQSVNPYISILAQASNGSFVESQHWLVDPNASQIGDIAAADFNGDGKIDLAALVTNGNSSNLTYTLYVYTNTSSGGTACSAPTAKDTNIICAPQTGTVKTSPVTVTAASNVTGFTLNRLYLDNNSVYQTTSQMINTPITTADGNHTLVLVSYNNEGQAFTSTTTFTVGASGCLPTSPGVNVCQPAAGTTADSPVTITAGALAQSGDITALRFYVDSVSVYTADNPGKTTSFQASQAVPLNAGSHRLVVVAYESTGAALTSSETFTVAPNTSCYPATGGAMICSPVKGEATTSPVQVSAGATAASGYITALALYVDNQQVNFEDDPYPYKSFSEVESVPMTKGTHNLVVVGYESTGAAVTVSETVTVQ